MSTHNASFCEDIRKISIEGKKKHLSGDMILQVAPYSDCFSFLLF